MRQDSWPFCTFWENQLVRALQFPVEQKHLTSQMNRMISPGFCVICFQKLLLSRHLALDCFFLQHFSTRAIVVPTGYWKGTVVLNCAYFSFWWALVISGREDGGYCVCKIFAKPKLILTNLNFNFKYTSELGLIWFHNPVHLKSICLDFSLWYFYTSLWNIF